MLPGIRFLLAAIVLSTSILIFGLGAAALLRAAHEEVANVPARRVMPEPVFAQVETPTLAALRVEPAAPAEAPEAPPAVRPVPEAVPVPKLETETPAALQLDDMPTAETATSNVAATPQAVAEPEAAVTEAPAPLPADAEPPPSGETRLAALDAAPAPPMEAASVPFEQIATPSMTDAGLRATKTAALGSPAAKVETPPEAKKTSAKPDRSEIRKKERAERARERRRQAARRARLAAQQAAAQQAATQQAADPFSQVLQIAQPTQPAATTARRR